MKIRALALAAILAASPAIAQQADFTVTENTEGGYTLEGDVRPAIKASDGEVALAHELGVAIGNALGADESIDYRKGKAFDGPQTISIARDDGTTGYYQVEGDVYAFAEEDTLREGDAMNALTGVIVFEAEVNGRIVMVADQGAISMIAG